LAATLQQSQWIDRSSSARLDSSIGDISPLNTRTTSTFTTTPPPTSSAPTNPHCTERGTAHLLGQRCAGKFVQASWQNPNQETSMAPKAKPHAKKNSLVANINKQKKAGTSRSKKNSTIDAAAYKNLEEDWGKK